MKDELSQLVEEFGRHVGLDELTLGENSATSLAIDAVELHLAADDDGRTLVMFADVGTPPHPDQTSREYYETLLKANFLHLGTGGATLGMDRDAGFVALMDRLAVAGLNAADLADRVERFVNLAEAWTQRLAELAAEPVATAPRTPDDFLRI